MSNPEGRDRHPRNGSTCGSPNAVGKAVGTKTTTTAAQGSVPEIDMCNDRATPLTSSLESDTCTVPAITTSSSVSTVTVNRPQPSNHTSGQLVKGGLIASNISWTTDEEERLRIMCPTSYSQSNSPLKFESLNGTVIDIRSSDEEMRGTSRTEKTSRTEGMKSGNS